MYVLLLKKVSGMKLHFIKEKEVVLTYRWQFQDERSKGMGTERCRGPAPVDPGNSKGGRRWRGKTCLFINVRLD